jgi:hypothetical protein
VARLGHTESRYVQRAETGRRTKKLTAFARWQRQGGYAKTCKVCQDIWQQCCEQIGEQLPFKRCSDCPATELLPGNVIAWEVYARCWNQVIVAGTGQVLGLNISAVYRVMESMDVPKDRHMEVLDKVNLVHSIIFPIKKEDDSGHDPDSSAR